MDVTLRPVPESEYDAFFAHFPAYHAELDAYDPRREPYDIQRGIEAILDDMDGRELLWIEADGRRSGFVMVRLDSDWPDIERTIASIAEFYVFPDARRSGIGTAAVEALLAQHRARGTYLVEASILRDNGPAKEFWARLGFEVHLFQTARRP
ncbi:MAG: GNAT family N-acetyltransferase [Dehalococcoidia bacterium]|nr:GNAT family N-acetyltransferase [Dehalococcoidia bacterium]